jgi:cellobiose phosphorylase
MTRFGRFDDAAREYVVSRPDTPLPWINYLGSEDYFGIISNTAGGYSFYRDARLRCVTRYRYNNAPFDVGGCYVYLRDRASGDLWSPSWQPVRSDLVDYRCRHGLGYTVIGGHRAGIDAETLYSVPLGETLEIWRTRITNQRTEPAELSRQRGRVLLVGRLGRRHELPAQLLDRRSRGGGRHHLPQDRVPRAPQPLRLLRLLR